MAKASSSTYRLSPLALSDLEEIWAYTFEMWGEQQADHYLDELAAGMAILANAPLSAPACDEIRVGYRRRAIGRHMIYYKLAKHGIDVLRILHQAMDAGSRLRH